MRKLLSRLDLTVFWKSFASPRFGEKTWNFRNPRNLTFLVWLKFALIIFDRFSKKFRIATIWRENLEFSKSDKPNFIPTNIHLTVIMILNLNLERLVSYFEFRKPIHDIRVIDFQDNIVTRILVTACLVWLFNSIFRLSVLLWLHRYKLIYRTKDIVCNQYWCFLALFIFQTTLLWYCILIFPSFKTLTCCAVLCIDIRSTAVSTIVGTV